MKMQAPEARAKKIVSEYKHWITEDVSAGGASENFLEEAIKNSYGEIISLFHTSSSGQQTQKVFRAGLQCCL